MSLTEEQKAIALKCIERFGATHEEWSVYLESSLFDADMVAEMFDDFLSRIREEQEAVYQIYDGDDCWYDVPKSMYKDSHLRKRIVFTIPPAAPECNELAEASVKLNDYLTSSACMVPGFDVPDEIYIPFSDSLAKHAKRMKGEE